MPKVKPKLKNSFKKLQKDEQLKNNRSRLHLPHLKPKATQTHIINNSISQPSFLYKPEHKILLIGEGNFSFAHSLIENVLPAAHSIIATSYDSEQIVYEKYKDSKEHIDSIKFFGGQSKKGMSAAEKRKRLEELFHETKDFYQLKELEKIAPKIKGIVSQSVKDVLQSLIDDNLVATDKIGTSNYFWSFPSSSLQSRKVKINTLKEEFTKLKEKNTELQNVIKQVSGDREESDDRTTKMKLLEEVESQRKQYLKELERYRECDPVLMEAKKKHAKLAFEAANRWTEFDRQFSIPEDFDTL
ncbi:5383_t:CDS:2 [Entrophospora sp. SA101]|nr:5383_t:CDS:2 [Entrophospora sp. SA101]